MIKINLRFFEKCLICFLLFLVISACQTKKKPVEIKRILIDDFNENTPVNLSEISDSIHYVSLETAQESFYGMIKKIITTANRLYVHDFTKGLTVFSLKGEYLYSISKRGRGPGEFLELSAFYINERECVKLIDNGNRKMLEFDTNGQFVKEYPKSFYTHCFIETEERYFVKPAVEDLYNLEEYDKNFELKKQMLSKDYDWCTSNVSGFKCFSKNLNGDIFYSYPYNDTIYRITNDGIECHRLIDFGKYKVPKSYYPPKAKAIGYDEELLNKLEGTRYYPIVIDYKEKEKYRMFTFFNYTYVNTYFENKINNKAYIGEYFYNDLDLIRQYMPPVVNENNLIFFFEAEKFIENLTKIKDGLDDLEWQRYLAKRPQLSEIYKTLTPNDNPVLMIVHIK